MIKYQTCNEKRTRRSDWEAQTFMTEIDDYPKAFGLIPVSRSGHTATVWWIYLIIYSSKKTLVVTKIQPLAYYILSRTLL